MKRTIYSKYIKRLLDIVCSLLALTLFSPLFLLLVVVVSIKMKGNPFFIQERPGYKEKIFRLIKFRTMTDARDENGNLLSDDERLTKFGRFLRSTSLDELPEAWNILRGDMSVIGPRPLLVEYLPYYTEKERHRHDVRPGLSGLAQVHGRNTVTWEEKFSWDLKYVKHCSFFLDLKIVVLTVIKTIKRADILVGKQFKVGKLMDERKDWIKTQDGAINPNRGTSKDK